MTQNECHQARAVYSWCLRLTIRRTQFTVVITHAHYLAEWVTYTYCHVTSLPRLSAFLCVILKSMETWERDYYMCILNLHVDTVVIITMMRSLTFTRLDALFQALKPPCCHAVVHTSCLQLRKSRHDATPATFVYMRMVRETQQTKMNQLHHRSLLERALYLSYATVVECTHNVHTHVYALQ